MTDTEFTSQVIDLAVRETRALKRLQRAWEVQDAEDEAFAELELQQVRKDIDALLASQVH